MTVASQNIKHWAGNTATIRIRVSDESGLAVNLLNASAEWWMAKKATSSGNDIFVKKDSNSGITIEQSTDIDSENNPYFDVVIPLLPDDTESIKPGHYYHECQVQDASGDVVTPTIGKFILMPTLIPADI